MNALILNNINQPLDFQEVAPYPTDKKSVWVDIKAAALNHRDLWISKGEYAGIRFPTILGSDGAGVYNGREVIINPSLSWGKKQDAQGRDFSILGLPHNGTFAEKVAVPAKNLVDKPKHLSWEQAAALPLAGVTAWRVLFSRCGLKKGEKVLVSGAGGGVALFVIQFAIAAGAEVWVTSGSNEKIAKAILMGVIGGVNYREDDWDKQLKTQAGGFDIVIDSAAGDQFPKLVGLCNPGGRLGIYGGTQGKINNLAPQVIFWKQVSILGSTMGSDRDFGQMIRFVQNHQIIPVVDSVFALKDGNDALARMKSGAQFGKIVLKVS
jgi:zinc-binding alcohol dehydrogenase/oxidoreductase